MKSLLAHDAYVGYADNYGKTALANTVWGNHAEAAHLLLDAGANPNACDQHGNSVLHEAAEKADPTILKDLLAHSAHPNADADGYSPLFNAAQRNQSESITILLDAGAEVDYQLNEGGETPLMWAAKENASEAVKVLIERGANVHHQADYGDSVLQVAMKRSHPDPVEAVHLLLEAGANPNQTTNEQGTTLVHHAAGKADPTIRREIGRASCRERV